MGSTRSGSTDPHRFSSPASRSSMRRSTGRRTASAAGGSWAAMGGSAGRSRAEELVRAAGDDLGQQIGHTEEQKAGGGVGQVVVGRDHDGEDGGSGIEE